jgi:rhamnosyl/mannosyltransferase
MKKIKVLQVNKLYAPYVGGIETIVKNIAEGLNEKTDMNVLVCRSKGKAITEIYENVKVTRAHSFGIFSSMPVSFDFFRKFKKLAKQADIIQFHVPFPLGDFALAFNKTKAKKIIWWHSDIINQKFFLKLLKPIIHRALKKADLIITATEGHINGSDFLKPYRDKCTIIPFGLDFKKYENQSINNFLHDKLNNKKSVKLLFVGRLVYYKGIDVLINAMSRINNAELFVVGDGVLKSEMIKLANILGLNEKIHFLEHLNFDELKAAFDDCDIFVFPSVANSEAFGIVQLEAMFYGKPVINTDLPTGVPFVSVNGETGITVKAGDIGELRDSMQELIDNEDKRKLYGLNAKKRVNEFYSIEKMLHDIHDKYINLLEN